MPKVKRELAQRHIVVVDTNILWDQDKKNPVAPLFDKFWQDNSKIIPMDLYVPEVVFGELHFQQSSSAIKALSAITEKFSDLSGITNTSYTHKCNDLKIKNQVEKKLDDWLKRHAGKKIVTPIDIIDWRSVIDSAIWRKPPFTLDTRDLKNEKGFRDALVLETLVGVHAGISSGEILIFLCNDQLLRTAAEFRMKGGRFLAFESTNDFEQYIKLTQQSLTKSFAESIQNHARSKFYIKDDQGTLYYKENIGDKIIADYSSALEYPTASLRLAALGEPYTAERIRRKSLIKSTQFDEATGSNVFHWISRIDVAQLFTIKRYQGGLIASAISNFERLYVVEFLVKWTSSVKTDGRFHNIQIVGIEAGKAQSLDASSENLERWKMDS